MFSEVRCDIDGLDDLNELISQAEQQAHELKKTVNQIEAARLDILIKLNQPKAGTNG